MEKQRTIFSRIERLEEALVGVLFIAGIIVLLLPIDLKVDKIFFISALLFVVVFVCGWHRLKLPISYENKKSIEFLVDLLIVAAVVHVSGGISSTFAFLYILPVFAGAVTISRSRAITIWVASGVPIFTELFLLTPSQNNIFLTSAFATALLIFFGVSLVFAHGLFLSREIQVAQIAATSATVEKEEAINKLKDEFLFVIAHELRGPITAIRGYIELFLTSGKEQNPKAKNLAEAAFRQSGNLNNLIGELLDVSRLETGKLKLSNEVCELNGFFKEMLKEAQAEAVGKKISFTYQPSPLNIFVETDKERLREVTLLLVENSLNFTNEFGQVKVVVNAKDGKAYISVIDNGVGIPQQEIPYIFERFYSSDGSKLQKQGGAGLGLFLVRSLVGKMGGEVSVESQVGKGSKFTFTLPIVPHQ
jgi:signal transduction histidine kinase